MKPITNMKVPKDAVYQNSKERFRVLEKKQR